MWRTEDEIDITKLPQLNEKEVHFLWRLQYQDGPMNGLAEYQGEKVWFDFHHMDDEGLHYCYVLYRLDLEQLNEALTWKRDEQRYNPVWLGPRLEGAEPLGWFRDGQNRDYYAIKVDYD